MGIIHKVGAIILDNKKILVGKKKEKFIIPGGRLEKGENNIECLRRELNEEFRVELVSSKYFGTFDDEAALDPGMTIHMDVYLTSIRGTPVASSEITEMRFIDSKNSERIKLGSILEKFVIPELARKKMID